MSDSPDLFRRMASATAAMASVLADHALCEDFFQLEELRLFRGEHLGHGDARPVGDDPRDVLLRDLLSQEARLAVQLFQLLAPRLQLALRLGKAPVLDLRRLGEVALPLVARLLYGELLQGDLELADLLDDSLLVLPLQLHGVPLGAQGCQLLVQHGEPLAGGGIGLL